MNEIELKQRATRILSRLIALGFTKEGKAPVIDQAYELVAAGEGLRNQHVLRVLAKRASTEAATGPKEYPRLVIPRYPDDAFIEAMLVEHGPHDEGDLDFACEAWDHVVAEAAKRAGLTVPITWDEEQAAERVWTDAVNRAGWDRESEIIQLEGFIRHMGLMGELAKYATKAADEESGIAVDLGDIELAADVVPEQLLVDKTGGRGGKGNAAQAALQARVVSGAEAKPGDALIAFLERVGFEVKDSDLHRPFWECGETGSPDYETEAEAWQAAYLAALETASEALGISMAEFTQQQEAAIMKAVERFNPRTIVEMTEVLDRIGFEFEKVGRQWAWKHVNDVFSRTLADSSTRAVAQAWAYAKVKTGLPDDVFDATPFEAQVVLLEEAFTGKVQTADRARELANLAFENYPFENTVVEANGWESTWTSGKGIFRRAVFLESPDGENTVKVIFTVLVADGEVSTNVSKS